MVWKFKKKGYTIDNIHKLSGNITDVIMKLSMKKMSADNVSVIFFAFDNFKKKIKDTNFEFIDSPICKFIGNEIDLNGEIS